MGRQREERDRRNGSQPEQSRISKRMVFRRTVILMLICGGGLFIPLMVQLWNISIQDHDFYQQKAAEQQLMDVAVAAHRGHLGRQRRGDSHVGHRLQPDPGSEGSDQQRGQGRL